MDYGDRVRQAVKYFWEMRARQLETQGRTTGVRDAGNRAAVTGGRHLDGFIALLRDILLEAGLPDDSVHSRQTTLPGYFRPTKDWDLIVVSGNALIASVELKAQVGPSFGNNFNNRVEEALGNSIDLLTAYREGKFRASPRPWLGWLMLLEQAPGSLTPVGVAEPHFPAFEAFRGRSYAGRYELFCDRLLRERMYDCACLLLSNQTDGLEGYYEEPNPQFGFNAFANSLSAHARAFVASGTGESRYRTREQL